MAKRSAQKFSGSYLDVADILNQSLRGHEAHGFTLSVDSDDPDFCSLYCHNCKEAVIMGSRELIETVWLDFISVVPRPL